MARTSSTDIHTTMAKAKQHKHCWKRSVASLQPSTVSEVTTRSVRKNSGNGGFWKNRRGSKKKVTDGDRGAINLQVRLLAAPCSQRLIPLYFFSNIERIQILQKLRLEDEERRRKELQEKQR